MHPRSQVSSVLLVVETRKIIFLIADTIPQKEDIILLFFGYHMVSPDKILNKYLWGNAAYVQPLACWSRTTLYCPRRNYLAGFGYGYTPMPKP